MDRFNGKTKEFNKMIMIKELIAVEMVMEYLALKKSENNKHWKMSFVLICKTWLYSNDLSHVMRKPAFCICKNKGTDQ